MRRRMVLYLAFVAAAVVLAALPGAAQQAETRGTITLRDGAAYTGLIEAARLGITEDMTDGVGTGIKDGGALALMVGTQKTLIPGSDIRRIDVTWQQTTDTSVGGWEITDITVTKKDGAKVSGRATWFLGCSFVRIDTADKGTVKIAAFPTSNDFDPGQLIVSVDLAAAGAAEPPAGTVPPPTVEPATPETTTPEVTAPAATTPAAPAATTPTTPTPVVGPAGAPAAPTGLTPAMITITIICPHCGQSITVTIPAAAQ